MRARSTVADPTLRLAMIRLAMIRFGVWLFVVWAMAAGSTLVRAQTAFPPLTGRVVDQANLLSPAERAAIEAKLADLENKSSIQFVVATVPSLDDRDIESYSVDLARTWKIGEAKKNNGLVLLVAPNQHKVRFEVGYGLEGVMTDAVSSVIIQSAILPKFKKGDFAGGVDAGVDAAIDTLSSDSSQWRQKAQVRLDQQPSLIDQIMPFLLLALFFYVLYSMVRAARGSRGWGGGPPIFIPMNWGGSGGGSFGGGSFGDGFSGGGGSFGGGGASGDW